MKNILILYNPYYEKNVIEQHLEILRQNGAVAFGKIRSKLRTYESEFQNELDEIYTNTSKSNPTQLFLTDYNNMYVANVIAVKENKTKIIKAPKYYDKLDVEMWYIFDDLRLLVHNDFQFIRDNILANFKAVNYNNHTYAVYGNKYVYPMQIEMKEEINYFLKDDEDFKYYINIFKTKEQIAMQENLINFNLGEKVFFNLDVNSQDNIINAEIEYINNKDNPLYDFSSVVVKYSKAFELELYKFIREIFRYLMEKDNSLKSFTYTLQSKNFRLENILEHKAAYGTYKHLLKAYDTRTAIHNFITDSKLKFFLLQELSEYISIMQNIRNESVHGNQTSLEECQEIRNNVVGIGKLGVINALNRNLKYLVKEI